MIRVVFSGVALPILSILVSRYAVVSVMSLSMGFPIAVVSNVPFLLSPQNYPC